MLVRLSTIMLSKNNFKKLFLYTWIALLAMLLNGCATGIHPFDQSQVPVISVSAGLTPTISFTPSPAYILRLYEGSEDKDGLGVFWQANGGDGYENNLTSPVNYAGSALTVGNTYTVTVERKDPLGSGDGFFNTRRKYVGEMTFVATTE